MKKLNNIKFLKDLIDSDFLIVNFSNLKIKNIHFLNSRIKLNRENFLDVLDILELNKSLKHIIRLLQFLSKEDLYSIYFWVENNYLTSLLDTFFIDLKKKITLNVKTTMPGYHSLILNKVLLILDNPTQSNCIKTNKKFINNNILLVNKINLTVEKNYYGHYKIFNSLNDLKKIIFLLIILRLVIDKKN